MQNPRRIKHRKASNINRKKPLPGYFFFKRQNSLEKIEPKSERSAEIDNIDVQNNADIQERQCGEYENEKDS